MGCGCSSNSGSNLPFNYVPQQTIPASTIPCDKTREEIEALAARAECAKREGTTLLLNAILGQLYSMLNLGEYCRYDTEYITTYLQSYEQECP